MPIVVGALQLLHPLVPVAERVERIYSDIEVEGIKEEHIVILILHLESENPVHVVPVVVVAVLLFLEVLIHPVIESGAAGQVQLQIVIVGVLIVDSHRPASYQIHQAPLNSNVISIPEEASDMVTEESVELVIPSIVIVSPLTE